MTERDIEAAAACLRVEAFGAEEAASFPLDLEVVLYDHLYDTHDVAYRDDRDLGHHDGDKTLGRTLPRRNAIHIDVSLKQAGPIGRFRFTIAHEVGHWVLHRELFLQDRHQVPMFAGDDADGDSLISLKRNVFPPAGHGKLPPEEWQANRFAIAFLVEEKRLRDEFRARFRTSSLSVSDFETTSVQTGQRELSLRAACHRSASLPPLTDVFGLSREAMAIALEARGYVNFEVPVV